MRYGKKGKGKMKVKAIHSLLRLRIDILTH
jgi:hypothetical protein